MQLYMKIFFYYQLIIFMIVFIMFTILAMFIYATFLLRALFTNKYALMRYLINTLQNKAHNNFNHNQIQLCRK